MSIIKVSNLTFSYEGSADNIFENVSFQMDTDWKLGFTGRNGRGKTTFMQLLLGRYSYSGKISASVTFEYFPYEVKDKSKDTIEIMREICPACMDWEMIREAALLDVEADALYRSFSTLSNGEQTKVLLAALFLTSNAFLLIDEPTNHLDMEARRSVGAYLKKKKGFILVSHDRNLLDACVDHILSINKTSIEIRKGNFTAWWEDKCRQDSHELAENERLKKDIGRLADAARRNADWSNKVEQSKFGQLNSGLKLDRGFVGHKSAKMMKRSKNIENRRQNAIAEKEGLLKNIEEQEVLRMSPQIFHKNRYIEARELSVYFGDKTVCSGVNFVISAGDRIALKGKNGSGKSSILKLVCGEKIRYEGSLSVAGGLKISYVSQDTSHLSGSLSDFAERCGLDETLFKTNLSKLGFERVQFEKDMADFSGGQKKKVLIAKSLSEKAHLYVWDEPLNFIDVISRMQIEDLILQYEPTLLFVEHDAAFCESILTGEIIL